ncbi:MAG: MBL fold metallo-hydrolase [Candidatus Kapabacteria bacterium]|nr:MBL fold metallo-hydrolase [Candidatus Kapabacteria bacterium]
MRSHVIYSQDGHEWIVIGRDTEKKEEIVDTNQYLIVSGNQGMILDPGGFEIFSSVIGEVTKYISVNNIKIIFSSHQDPDIASSLALWVDIIKDVDTYCWWGWQGFLAHFGMGNAIKLIGIPDEGMEVQIGTSNSFQYFVPAHYCHSSGNYSVFDPKAKILFSGDIGAALLPSDYTDLFVTNFDSHIQFMEGFHKRWMSSTKDLRAWVARARALNPSMICPQHGAIFEGENVGRFLNWLEALEVGHWNRGQEDTNVNNCVWMKWKK